VGRPSTRGLRRAIAFTVVAGLHGLTIALLLAPRNRPTLSLSNDFVSTAVLLSTTPRPAAHSSQLQFNTASDAPPLATVEPAIALPAQVSSSVDPGAGVDWTLAGQQTVAAMAFPPNVRGFGANPAVASAHTGARPLPGHVSGEQYRTTDGAWVVWVSDRCYLVSEVPPVGLPDVLARSIPTRTVCEADAESRGELFKDLAAYAKYHLH
jgi:hypothetical protein